MKNKTVCLILFYILSLHGTNLYGYNLRKIANMENLSNNSVTSLCQDQRGNLWIGTCDGLNVYNGHKVSAYQSEHPNHTLSGTLIDKITAVDLNTLWLQSYHGVDRLNIHDQQIKKYNEFNKRLFTDRDSYNTFYIIQKDSCIFYCNQTNEAFTRIPVPDIAFNAIHSFFIDAGNVMRIVLHNGHSLNYRIILSDAGKVTLHKEKGYTHATTIIHAFKYNEGILLVDNKYDLYEYNTGKQKVNYVLNIKELCLKNGSISSMIKFHDDYFIGYTTSGLYKLRKDVYGYLAENIQISSGVFCLLADRHQEIVWIGTDGQGVYSYSNEHYSIRSTLLSKVNPRMNRPVRAICRDAENTLWLGSKGDGIMKVYNYTAGKNILDCKTEHLTTHNSALWDNAVYSFTQSTQKDILWIGTEEGLNYYSARDRQIKQLKLTHQGENIRFIHTVYEQDSVLWIASVGMGIVKARLKWHGNNPQVEVMNRFLVNKGEMLSNYFFSFFVEGDSIWAANRGSGVFILHTRTHQIENITFNSNTLNEIYSIAKDDDNQYLIGTGSGLIKYKNRNEYVIMNKFSGFPNNIIHCILPEEDGTFWLSTNSGVINYDSKNNTFRKYNHLDGLEVFEFSDGAGFNDPHSRCTYFGGINGFITIVENDDYRPYNYTPPIYFTDLSIFGEKHNLAEYLSVENGTEILTLNYDRNFFSITAGAIDYLNGGNYLYQYRLAETGSQWVNNGNSGSISFTDFNPGEYTLEIRYYNMATRKESPVHQLRIRILPPWYQTNLARFFYALFLMGCVAAAVAGIIIREKKKKRRTLQQIAQKHKEEVYESKLRFFTNIAHEFCTPLTLIYGPCNRILSQKNADKAVVKYTKIIQQNAERLNTLIQDLIEFRRIETGHKSICIAKVDVTWLTTHVINAFTDLAESRDIVLTNDINPDVTWNSDKDFLITISTNLLSNAFKYTNDNGEIKLSVSATAGELTLTVSNTGKGIRREDIPKVFDRYSILESFENTNHARLSPRNGLGLAISNNMVKLLGGVIHIESTPGEWTHFIVKLPFIEQVDAKPQPAVFPDIKRLDSAQPEVVLPKATFKEAKPTLLAIDDEPEILWLIADIFMEEFNVITTENVQDALNVLNNIYPDIILCDIMLQDVNGITFTRQIKTNPETAHIPLVLISANHEVDKQIEGMDAGAELYVTKPFNTEYLKTSVKQLIVRKEMLKNYFASPESAYELTNGKLKHKEHKKAMKEILNIVHKNIRNKELSADFIADKLSLSRRSLYRKISEISDSGITDIIRECRLHVAADLLIKSKLSVEEIIYESGFANRGSFFKAFSKKYGCTPGEYRNTNNKTTTQ